MSAEACIVQALFSFKGTNNDELCFKKGDKITITQKEDGGWWEGTLGEKTGWFPTNYVKEIKDTISIISPISQQRQYRAVVLNDLIDSEKAHVTELQGLVKTFLKPLEKTTILTTDEYRQLVGNIYEVLDTHQTLLELLEECERQPSEEQRVGKLFLTGAPKIKAVHQAYCSTHPRAVCILDLHKDELATYMESCGAATPGLLVLTTGLSKPFRRLDKYSGMLQELERHVELNHPDRGDTQRSVAIFKDIAATCAATRRQKELELQVLTGPVRGWEGQSLAQLGDILHMGSVAVGTQHQDRYLVLFPNNLLVLSVSHRMSAFIYEGKLPLTGITINRLEDTENCKNAFDISGPMIEKIVALCQSKEEANNWVDLLRQHTKGYQKTPPPNSTGDAAPTPPPHLDRRGYCIRQSILNYTYSPPIPYKITYPPYFYPPASPYSTLTKSFYRLVKERVITHRLLKRLLYPEFNNLSKFDLGLVRVRKHKTECFIKTGSISDSDSDSDDANKLHRQNAIIRNSDSSSSSGSCESNPFGFIKYFNPETQTTNDFESFIDHGANIEQVQIETSERNELVNQVSQESSEWGTNKPYMACEDLLNMDGSLEYETLGQRQYVPKSHQSLPSKFVANRFNKSSLTMVYIPHWSNSDSKLTRSKTISRSDSSKSECSNRNSIEMKTSSKIKSRSNSSSSDTTTHSSCLDLPGNPIPVPDAMAAEILYNSELTQTIDIEQDSIRPPFMFRNLSQTDSISPSLSIKTASFSRKSKPTIEQNLTEAAVQKTEEFCMKEAWTNFSKEPSTITNLNTNESTPSYLKVKQNSDSVLRLSNLSKQKENDPVLIEPVLLSSSLSNITFKPEPKQNIGATVSNIKELKPIEEILNMKYLNENKLTSLSNMKLNESADSDLSNLNSISNKTEQITLEPSLSLSLTSLKFRKHSFNSDKPKRRSSTHDTLETDHPALKEAVLRYSSEQQRNDRRPHSRKCVSYHYLQLSNPGASCSSQYCRCTEHCSRRSSDSGMAGSCTLHSPDLAGANDVFPNRDHYDNYDCLLDNLTETDFEAQCRCTSPFGSTPRTSCQASTSENILVGSRDSTTSVTSSSSDMSPFPPHPWESENQIYDKLMTMKDQKVECLDKEQQWHPNNTFKSKSCGDFTLQEPEIQEREVFRSGLYAHWWMKAKLPNAVIRGILEESAGKGFSVV